MTPPGSPTPPRWSAPFPADRQTLEPGRVGRLRLLHLPLPVLLGPASASDLHDRRAADHLEPDQPEDRQTTTRLRPYSSSSLDDAMHEDRLFGQREQCQMQASGSFLAISKLSKSGAGETIAYRDTGENTPLALPCPRVIGLH